MIPLGFPFSRSQFRHVLLKRDGPVCLVERTNELTDSVHWEVVVLQPARPYGAPAGTPPDHEAYPASNEWGTWGWTYTTLPEAETRFQKQVSARDENG